MARRPRRALRARGLVKHDRRWARSCRARARVRHRSCGAAACGHSRCGTEGVTATMRDRFYGTLSELLGADERIAVVLADIGTGRMSEAERAHAERVINVGIREQLLVGVAAGLAMTGFRPIVHSYTPFVVERPFEMLKLDLGHNDVGAIVVSVGASYDAAANGRTHQTSEDVALLSALPGWRIYLPGHPTEADQLIRAAARTDERVYIPLSEQSNQLPRPTTPGRPPL